MTTQEPIAPTAEAHPVDPIRIQYRRIVGFTTTVQSGCEAADLEASLRRLARGTAFRLRRLQPLAGAPDLYEAEYQPRAARAAGGDAQIFVVLRAIAEHHRWNGVTKHVVVHA